MEEEKQEIELEQEYAVLEPFPEKAIDLALNVRVYQNGEIINVHTAMGFRELSEALQETKEGYVPNWRDDDPEPVKDCLVISVPRDAVEIEILAHFLSDGELILFSRRMDVTEIRQAFQKAGDYIPEDAVFTLTDKGKELAELFMKEKLEEAERV